jgi:hypothetical protein
MHRMFPIRSVKRASRARLPENLDLPRQCALLPSSRSDHLRRPRDESSASVPSGSPERV